MVKQNYLTTPYIKKFETLHFRKKENRLAKSDNSVIGKVVKKEQALQKNS